MQYIIPITLPGLEALIQQDMDLNRKLLEMNSSNWGHTQYKEAVPTGRTNTFNFCK